MRERLAVLHQPDVSARDVHVARALIFEGVGGELERGVVERSVEHRRCGFRNEQGYHQRPDDHDSATHASSPAKPEIPR